MLRSIRRLACIALLGTATVGLSASAQAGYGYGHYHGPHCYYKEVIAYKLISEPYVKLITVFDSYGYPQTIEKTFLRQVQVPVTTLVKVCY